MKHGEVIQDWADGTYTFRLPIGAWRELRDKTQAGPLELYHRVLAGKWFVDDLREVIRLGLIGGGASPAEALKLVQRYVDERPLLESVPLALTLMAAVLAAPEGDEPKKANRRGNQAARSASPISTERVQ